MITLILHRLPDLLMVVVAAWLGLGLLVRAPDNRVIRAFAVFCAHIVLYGITAIQYHLTTSQDVALFLGRAELVAIVLTPPSFLLFMVFLTTQGCVRKRHTLLVGFFYVTGIALAIYAIVGNLVHPQPMILAWTRWEEPRFPTGWLTWASAAQRIVPLITALVLMWQEYSGKPADVYEKPLRLTLWVAAILGVIGAITATAARELSWSPALPRMLIVTALLIFTYSVLTHRGMISARATKRAFLYSILGSLFTITYVGIVMLLEWGAGELLHINIPLVSALSIIALAAAFGPIGEWVRGQIDRRFYPRVFDYSQLLKSLSDEFLDRGDLQEQLKSGLTWICRTLDVPQGVVATVNDDGIVVRALYGGVATPKTITNIELPDDMEEVEGTWEALPFARLLLPLQRGDESLGLLALGERPFNHSEQEVYSDTERALLEHLGSYLALAIDHGRLQDNHRSVMETLSVQSKTLREQQEQLAKQAAQTTETERTESASAKTPSSQLAKLRVYALGALRVERDDGEAITRWGGDKAGTYQAEALFAFLFDRRGKGITKDEAEEVIWTDLEISKADSAFHRTLAALRRTLEPGLRRGNQSRLITYHHERYWLEPGCVDWCDVDVFVDEVERGGNLFRQQKFDESLNVLESAHQLYRGDYMDDCPFFGDSSFVEDHRAPLRSRYVELLLMLGAMYEAQGRAGDAASCYRQALSLSSNDCPLASDGLARLQDKLLG